MTGLASARRRFDTAGLPAPPVPDDLSGQLRPIGDFLFATRDDGPGPYNLEWYVDEFVSGRCTEPYLITGHDGRGMNSWAMHYLLVHGALALFDQIAWGGAYTADDQAMQMMRVHWAQIGDMIAAADLATARGLLAGDERFVVVLSDFYGSRWARGRPGDALTWHAGGSPLEVLLDAVIEVQELGESKE